MSALTYVLIRYLWLPLPLPAQAVLGIGVIGLVGYAIVAWLRGAKNNRLAHA
jgi:hypothetical protein